MLIFDLPSLTVPTPPPDLVRVRGRRGRVAARAGSSRRSDRDGSRAAPTSRRRSCEFPDGTTAAVPLGDLERFV